MDSSVRNVLLVVSLAIALPGLLIVAFFAYDRLSQPALITGALKEYTSHPELFSTHKLTDYGVDGPYNLNGDEELHGVYKLSPKEITTLLRDKPIFNCARTGTCEQYDQPQGGYYCESAKEVGHDLLISVCVHDDENQVYWNYTFY